MSDSASSAPTGSTTPPGSPPPLSPPQPPTKTSTTEDSAHKPLVRELAAILQSRPPVSNSKVNAITKYAVANRATAAEQVADLIVDFIQRCPADYKLSGLYLVDAIIRADTASTPPTQNPFVLRFKEKLPYATGAITQCPDKDKIKIKKVLDIWRDRSMFPVEFLAKAEDKWCRLSDPGAAASKASAPPKGMPPQLRQPSGSSMPPQPQPQQPVPPATMPNVPVSNPMAFFAALGGGGPGGRPPTMAAPPMFNIPGQQLQQLQQLQQQQQQQQQQAAPDLSNLLASLANTFGAAPPSGMPSFPPAPPMLSLGGAGAAPPTLNLANMLAVPGSSASTPGGPGSAHGNPLASLLTQAMSNTTSNASANKPILPPGMEHDPAFKSMRRNDDDDGPADFKTARLKQSPEEAAECDRLLNTDWRVTPVSRGGLTTWTQVEGGGVGRNEIRVLARTLFVSGITKDVTKSQLYELFGQHGTVESVMINYPKANAFIKLHTRSQASSAKSALDSHVLHFPHTSMAPPTTLRIRWGCGFGPKPKFDWDHGIQVVDFDQELDAFDKKFLMTSPAGGIREGVLRGGLTVEEPEVDTLEIKRWKLANPGVDLGVGTARFIGGGGGGGDDEDSRRSYYKESEAGRGRGRGSRGRGRGGRGGGERGGRGRGGSDRSGEYDRYDDDDEDNSSSARRGGGYDGGRDRDYPSYGQGGGGRSPAPGAGAGGYDGGYKQQQQAYGGGGQGGGAGGYNGGYGAGAGAGEQALPPWLQQQQQQQGATGGYANGAPQKQQQQPYGSPAYGGGQQQQGQGQGGYNGGYQGY